MRWELQRRYFIVRNHPVRLIYLWIDQTNRPLLTLPPYEPAELLSLIESMLTDEQRETFRRELELDFGYGVPGLSRFRVNVFRQRGNIGAAIRTIPMKVPTIADLRPPTGRGGRTRTPSPTPCATCCGRTPTSSSSGRCATWKRSPRRSPRRRPATRALPPRTPRAPPMLGGRGETAGALSPPWRCCG